MKRSRKDKKGFQNKVERQDTSPVVQDHLTLAHDLNLESTAKTTRTSQLTSNPHFLSNSSTGSCTNSCSCNGTCVSPFLFPPPYRCPTTTPHPTSNPKQVPKTLNFISSLALLNARVYHSGRRRYPSGEGGIEFIGRFGARGASAGAGRLRYRSTPNVPLFVIKRSRMLSHF